MTFPMKMLLVLVGITAANARGQTRIDLQRQTTNVDFTKAPVTRPVKTGDSLPSICSIGDLYFYTPGPAGANLYACTAVDTRSLQNGGTALPPIAGDDGKVLSINGTTLTWTALAGDLSGSADHNNVSGLQGRPVAATAPQPGQFLGWNAVNSSWEPQPLSDVSQTVQSGRALLCESNSGSSTVFTCSVAPALTQYTTGMVIHWKPDVNGAGGGTSLAIGSCGPKPLKTANGTSDPTSQDIIAGRLYMVWFDGTVFRLPPTPALATQTEAEAGVRADVFMSPARTADAIAKLTAIPGQSVLTRFARLHSTGVSSVWGVDPYDNIVQRSVMATGKANQADLTTQGINGSFSTGTGITTTGVYATATTPAMLKVSLTNTSNYFYPYVEYPFHSSWDWVLSSEVMLSTTSNVWMQLGTANVPGQDLTYESGSSPAYFGVTVALFSFVTNTAYKSPADTTIRAVLSNANGTGDSTNNTSCDTGVTPTVGVPLKFRIVHDATLSGGYRWFINGTEVCSSMVQTNAPSNVALTTAILFGTTAVTPVDFYFHYWTLTSTN